MKCKNPECAHYAVGKNVYCETCHDMRETAASFRRAFAYFYEMDESNLSRFLRREGLQNSIRTGTYPRPKLAPTPRSRRFLSRLQYACVAGADPRTLDMGKKYINGKYDAGNLEVSARFKDLVEGRVKKLHWWEKRVNLNRSWVESYCPRITPERIRLACVAGVSPEEFDGSMPLKVSDRFKEIVKAFEELEEIELKWWEKEVDLGAPWVKGYYDYEKELNDL